MRLKRKQSVMLLGCSAHRNISVNSISPSLSTFSVYVYCMCVHIGVYVCICVYVCMYLCVTLNKLDDVVENFKDSKDD